jgi:hypothetical protein
MQIHNLLIDSKIKSLKQNHLEHPFQSLSISGFLDNPEQDLSHGIKNCRSKKLLFSWMWCF